MDGNGHNPTQKAAPSPVVELKISFDQMTGAVRVDGPIQNPMFCYGILEMARQAIQNFAAEQAQGKKIVPANTLPFARH
jgi:hypothetical protein